MVFLYNHELRLNEELESDIWRYYGARVLACTAPGDIIQLDPALREEYPVILRHYETVGIACARQVIWSIEPERARGYAHLPLSTYMFNRQLSDIWPDTTRLRAVEAYNNKNTFLKLCLQLGLPVPKTHFYDQQAAPAWTGAFPVFVKKTVSTSGMGVYRCQTPGGLKRRVASMNEPYQLQQEVVAEAFLNVQYEADVGGIVRHIATTEQLLDGFAHIGNSYPSSHDPREVTDRAARAVAKAGVKGIFAIDVAVTSDGDYLIIECNPRWNGASYPTIVAARLGAKEWQCRTVKVAARSLHDIALGDIEYTPARGKGIIIISWGTVKRGKLSVLAVGDPEEQAEYLRRFITLAG